jgi:hypothetical protein
MRTTGGDDGLEPSRAVSPCTRKTENLNPSGLPPTPFPAGAGPWPVHLPSEEGGLLESQRRGAASASNGARLLAGSPSMSVQGGIRTHTAEGLSLVPPTKLGYLDKCALCDWDRRGCQLRRRIILSGYRESDPGLHHGKVTRCHYATSAGFIYRLAFAVEFALQQTSHLQPSL